MGCTSVELPLRLNEEFYPRSTWLSGEPYFNNENSIPAYTRTPPRCKLRAHEMRAWQHTRDRYKPRAGVSLICLMSRYCNDFASDLRLFIYSPAVLADRTLITGASRYTNGIKVPASAPRCLNPFRHGAALASPSRWGCRANFVNELATGKVIYHRCVAAGDGTSTSGNPREFLVPLRNRSFDKWLLAKLPLYIAAMKNAYFYRAHATSTSHVLHTLSF